MLPASAPALLWPLAYFFTVKGVPDWNLHMPVKSYKYCNTPQLKISIGHGDDGMITVLCP
jgi:hypothetical protein